jgi:hypothetical protein
MNGYHRLFNLVLAITPPDYPAKSAISGIPYLPAIGFAAFAADYLS